MFATTHPSGRARLGGSVLPLANDARPATCSGLRGCGVGGVFFIHVGSVFFCPKKALRTVTKISLAFVMPQKEVVYG
jgi:hypothetical protein